MNNIIFKYEDMLTVFYCANNKSRNARTVNEELLLELYSYLSGLYYIVMVAGYLLIIYKLNMQG